MEDLKEVNNVGKKIDIPGVITGLRDEQDGAPVEQKKKVANPFSFLNISKGTAEKIQSDADESQVSKLLNHLIFGMIPCKNRKLTEEEVQTINPGGGIIASVMVVAPNLPLNHPFLILGIRVVTLYLKVKMICNVVTEKYESFKDKLGGVKECVETIAHK
jgi:hypothetical protein